MINDVSSTDVELLRTEIETLWVPDETGRLLRARRRTFRAAPELVLAVGADGGQCLAFGVDVPDLVARELEAVVNSAAAAADLAEPPSSVARCMELLEEACGPVVLSSGLSYVIPPRVRFSSTAAVTRSDDADVSSLGGHAPSSANWNDDEWRMLLDGVLGPWATASIDGRIVSICHCARLAAKGAEAGVWTDPDFRGQGHAAAVVVAWASLVAPTGRHLFYSTFRENRSSRRVAARLSLRQIGWIWEISISQRPIARHRTTPDPYSLSVDPRPALTSVARRAIEKELQ
jgi:RimJ/RimL family protein N-acetyltransferase